jgi:hypothetical protein
MRRSIVVGLMIVLGSADIARAQSRTEVLWIVSGGGVGFGVGLWAGLTAFDDDVNSDRKVWTSAIVGAGVGAVAGYLIGRARNDRSRPAKVVNEMQMVQRAAAERRLLDALAKSFRFDCSGRSPVPFDDGEKYAGFARRGTLQLVGGGDHAGDCLRTQGVGGSSVR